MLEPVERATDVADAVRRIAADPSARFIAGGTNLIDLMKEGVERITPEWRPDPVTKLALRVPVEEAGSAEILGYGPEAAPAVVELMRRIGVLA